MLFEGMTKPLLCSSVFIIYKVKIGMFEHRPHTWSHPCMLMCLHCSNSSSFLFDMQIFWLEEFRSFCLTLKPLHQGGRICGMPSSCGLQIQRKSVIKVCWGRICKSVRMSLLQHSQLSSWMEKSAEGLWVCSDFSGQKSSGWHWATQAVSLLTTFALEDIGPFILCYYG